MSDTPKEPNGYYLTPPFLSSMACTCASYLCVGTAKVYCQRHAGHEPPHKYTNPPDAWCKVTITWEPNEDERHG